jgi:hypothetical protein
MHFFECMLILYVCAVHTLQGACEMYIVPAPFLHVFINNLHVRSTWPKSLSFQAYYWDALVLVHDTCVLKCLARCMHLCVYTQLGFLKS